MLVWMLIAGCEVVEPSWELLSVTESAQEPPVAEGAVPGFEFPTEEELAADLDPWVIPDGTEDVTEAEAEVAEPVEPAVEDVAEAEAVVRTTDDLHSPVGLPTQNDWGLRLLQTLPNAQPPRAAVGLPNGDEVVVSPGSMLPDVGIVIVSVGEGMAQIAKVTPAGDHATVESATLVAQYGGAGTAAP